MQLVAIDILEQARGLSYAASGSGIALGLTLWLFGWYAHRFWTVFFGTLAAGVYGLLQGPAHGVQPLVAGLLLALLAGLLSLRLVRLLAYFAGGIAALFVVRLLWPRWEEPIVCLLAGALLGFFWFRFWVMALTSFLGGLLMLYSSLCLLDRLGKLDMLLWADKHTRGLNWACAALTVVGLLGQFLLERRRQQKQAAADKAKKEAEKKAKEAKPADGSKAKSWWDWSKEQLRRVA